ncbi:hypothetical protein [Corallococcus silvisoli]|uniref:hypothetical protein n=1 Tax=Corallococcus silvisoli TaxID=2697031 RepID=UPI001376E37E|nr:hypothetical protein [Corallococcus silvisoli]NBD11805.1 hypothetical protein [Corallococcus silvisoli]
MPTKRGARAAPRSTRSELFAATDDLASIPHPTLSAAYRGLESAVHDVCDVYGVPPCMGSAPARLHTLQGTLVANDARHESEKAALHAQFATVQSLVRGAAEAFDGTATGQVLDGLLLQMAAVTKGGAQ